MKNSRRSFIRTTSLATTGLLFLSTKENKNKSAVIGCGPNVSPLSGTISSVKSGNWSDPATWGGRVPQLSDTPLISSGHTVKFDTNATVSGVNINPNALLVFDDQRSAALQSAKNVVVQGTLKMIPVSFSVVQTLKFINVDESKFVGGGMDVLSTDIGLWVMGAGQLDLQGTKKSSWTNTITSVAKGAASFTVDDASDWQIGDEVMIVPTDKAIPMNWNWDYFNNIPVDPFSNQFERRKIKTIAGNTITLDRALDYAHNEVVADATKKWLPEVANLTRNVIITGTDRGRAHIFIRSTNLQTLRYVEGLYLGPRKIQAGNNNIPQLITGRYGLHFHHCDDGSVGSVVAGCSFHDLGNRVYVPHVSNGITFRKNIAFNTLEEMFWWDVPEISHDIIYRYNLMAMGLFNGIGAGLGKTGMMLGSGEGNKAVHNVAVYVHNDNNTIGGAFNWDEANSSVWIFKNNLAHSNGLGVGVTQATTKVNVISNFDSYNCDQGIYHGGYINPFIYERGYHYNSKVDVHASARSYYSAFKDITFDGANLLDYPVFTEDGIFSSTLPNKFIECTFKNYKKEGLYIISRSGASDKHYKWIDLICCTFTGKAYAIDTLSTIAGNQVRLEPLSGQCVQTDEAASKNLITKNIQPFAAKLWGNGNGLSGVYYNGSNFNSEAFTRIDPMILFEWLTDPLDVNHLLTGDDFSIRWTGHIEAQFSESYQFKVQGSGGYRLWINNVLILDQWQELFDNTYYALSNKINLVAGQKYDFKLEYHDSGGPRSAFLYWQCPSMEADFWENVPQCQLYSPDSLESQLLDDDDENNNYTENNITAKETNTTSQSLNIIAYPNPSSSNFKLLVTSHSNSPITLIIYNRWGVRLFAYQNLNSNSTVTIGSNLKAGSYQAVAEQNGERKTIALIKM